MKRINSEYRVKNRPWFNTEIYKYFKFYFDFFLTPEPDYDDFETYKKAYVPNRLIENHLSDFTKFSSCVQLLCGFTGIGKTTIIKNFFDLRNENPIIRDNIAIIPIFCDSDVDLPTPSNFFGGQLSALSKIIIDKQNVKVTPQEIWEQADKDKSRLLAEVRLNDEIDIEKDIERLKKNKFFAYQAEKLKALIAKTKCVDSIIFILDDLESVQDEKELDSYLYFITKVFKCLRNTTFKLSVKVLISERPHTIKHFSKFDWIDNKKEFDFIITRIPKLEDIFLKKNEIALAKCENDPQQRESYQESLSMLCDLLHNVERNGGDSITMLNNFNIRKSMRIVEKSLACSEEYEKKSRYEYGRQLKSGKLKKLNFNPSHATLIRAISYLNQVVYKEAHNLPLKNPFNCHDNPDYWPLIFYIMSWFYYRSDNEDPCNIENSFSISYLKSDFSLVFPAISHINSSTDRIINELEQRKILWKNPFKTGEYLISPRGIFIFKELNTSNVLLEVYRDDILLDEFNGYNFTATLDIKYEKRFKECYKIIRHFTDLEEQYLKSIITTAQLNTFKHSFNSKTISKHFFEGLESSRNKISFSTDDHKRIIKYRDKAEKEVKLLDKYINEKP